MSITIRTISSIGILSISGTTMVDLVQAIGVDVIRALIAPTPQTAPDLSHLVTVFVGGDPFAISFVQWTQEEIDAVTVKEVLLTGTADLPQTGSFVVEVDPQ